MVELKDVHLSKGEYVILDRVSWAVQQGQCWAVKGLNGAGKSSIVKLVTVGGGSSSSRKSDPTPGPPLRTRTRHQTGFFPNLIGLALTYVFVQLRSCCVQEAHERRLQHQQPAASKQHGGFTGRVAVGVPHMGLVSTEVHLSLAARMANVRTDAVVLSGLPTLAAG